MIGTAELGILLILAIPALIIITVLAAAGQGRRERHRQDQLAAQALADQLAQTAALTAANRMAADPAAADTWAGSQDLPRRALHDDTTTLRQHHITSTPWRQ